MCLLVAFTHDSSFQLAQSAHLDRTILQGEYRGLKPEDSAIEVATAIHEQFNALESIPIEGRRIVERELVRRGFDSTGVKESVSLGWEKLRSAQKQYMEIVEAKVDRCERGNLTDSDSLKLYVSEFHKETVLSKVECTFLQAQRKESAGERKSSEPSEEFQQQSSFVEKAARIGISITPYTGRNSVAGPQLYQFEQRHDVPSGFEQINEDMFSRKDNKFMVFNGAGVDSWSGIQPITKISHKLIIFS